MISERPETGQPVPNGWFARLWQDVKSRRCVGDGKNIAVKQTADGQIISFIGKTPEPQAVAAAQTIRLAVIRIMPEEGVGVAEVEFVTVNNDGSITRTGETATAVIPQM